MSVARRPWLVALALLVAAVGGLLTANAIDEELTPEAGAFFARPPAAFATDSGWALIAGFHAPPGEDPSTYAAELRRAAGHRAVEAAGSIGSLELDVVAAPELLCSPSEIDCVAAFHARPDSIAELRAANRELVERYGALQRTTGLFDVHETLDYFAGKMPRFSTVLKAQQVELSRLGVLAAQGRAGEAIEGLAADAAFQRRWLEQAGTIIAKMVAARAFSRDVLLAGQIARAAPAMPAPAWRRLGDIAAPLTVPQRAMAPAFRVEAALLAEILDQLREDERGTTRVVGISRIAAAPAGSLRRNATLNFALPVWQAWTRLDGIPSDRLAAATDDIDRAAREYLAPGWRWIYNPSGKWFVAETYLGLGEYAYRVRDVDALAALVRCVIALRGEGVAPAEAGGFVSSHEACRDPYESRAFAWDERTREVSFRPRAKGDVKRLGGRGDRVAFAAYPAP